MVGSRLKGDNMVRVPWFIADRKVATWFEYHNPWRLVLLVLPVISFSLVRPRSDAIEYEVRRPCGTSSSEASLMREVEMTSRYFC